MSVTRQELLRLFSKPLPSSRTGVFYNTFSYQTKISPESIGVYIAAITNPGDTIIDTFGGSGSTAVAALLCEHPTELMKCLAQELGVNPKWGPRNAVLYELGTYGSFATRTLTNRLAASDYKTAVDDFLKKAEALTAGLYDAIDPTGAVGTIRYVLWSEYIKCPHCGKEMSYFECCTSRNPVVFKEVVSCPSCGTTSSIDTCSPVIEEYFDRLLKKRIQRKKRAIAWVYGQTGNWKWDRPVNESDEAFLSRINRLPFDKNDAPRMIQWGDLWRSGYHLGITHLHHFYTQRNYIVMDRLWRLASTYEGNVADALHLLLLSYNASHCTMMTRVVAKKNSKDFVLTGAQSGVLYISRIPVEKNILSGLKRKAKPFYEAYQLLETCSGRIVINNSSSEELQECSASIDYAFTDPPFGDFIPYAEVNQINELWLPKLTDRGKELIISSAQGKGVDKYCAMLGRVFSEIARVLKPERFATIVFHAAKANVWNAFGDAIDKSGLNICLTTILNKTQSSFKQIVSPDSVQGDPMLLLKKTRRVQHGKDHPQDRVLEKMIESIHGSEEVDERRVYSLYVNTCLKSGVPILFDAKEAYRKIEEKMAGSRHD